MQLELLTPDWEAPPEVRALSTTRTGGQSRAPYDGLNLADHVGDDPARVRANRELLRSCCGLPAAPHWLRQVHGCQVSRVTTAGAGSEHGPEPTEADAALASSPGVVCAVMTADCLPVLLCDDAGQVVAAAHAGWRGLAAGVLECTVARMGCAGEDLHAWLGPAIGPEHFEVGDEVRKMFCAQSEQAATAFRPNPRGRWLADLYLLARQRLRAMGVWRISGGDLCTYSDAQRFFSHRRDRVTGRMASLIWLQAPSASEASASAAEDVNAGAVP